MKRAFAVVFCLLPFAGQAAEVDRAREYAACMNEARTKPKEAFDRAVAWRDLGGGPAADHCAAVALLNLGSPAEAAKRLENLAQTLKQDAAFKARVLAQAAQAWMLGGDMARAEAVASSALVLQPDNAELFVDRAVIRAGRNDYKSAVMDLDRAVGLLPNRPDALVFRASAHRFLDNLDKALADVERALALDPNHPEGLLERGILRRMKGNDAGARQDWMQLLRNAPDGDTAAAARANLEKMDVKAGK
ncbi:MAG: tetratricopeptide repeat protein [Magnetospirillum sp. WYHS-4]